MTSKASFAALVVLTDTGEDRYAASAAPEKGGRMFGGQLLAQGMAAAQRTLGDERRVHSLHAYFLRAGDVDSPLVLEVERVRDGRSFSARSVRVLQNDRELCRMLLSFHAVEDGLEYASAQMPDVPPPEEVSLTYNEFARAQQGDPDEAWDGEARPIDIRYIDAPTAAQGVPVREDQRMWMRIPERLPDSGNVHDAGVAYVSDSTVIDHILLPHGYRWHDGLFDGVSLDHAMWFHRRARADEWLLFDQTALWTGAGRGLANGRLFDMDGRLIATCTQEGLIRRR